MEMIDWLIDWFDWTGLIRSEKNNILLQLDELIKNKIYLLFNWSTYSIIWLNPDSNMNFMKHFNQVSPLIN